MTKRLLGTAICVWILGLSPALSAEDILINDFEANNYGGWEAEGNAFGSSPAKGKIGGQHPVHGYKGEGLVNTFLNGDRSTGTLTSPPFKVERNYISFLIGGGSHKNTCLQLLVDGEVKASQSGYNDEELVPGFFDVRELKGKTVRLRIVDKATGGWGHVNVDQIVLTDKKPDIPERPEEREKEFTVKKRYLIMPIRNKGGRGSTIHLYIDGEEVRRYGLKLAPTPELTDWYAFFTIENYKGKTARVEATTTEEGFALIKQSDTIPGGENFYKEPYRPQFHFTQKVGWNNDPNGLVYHKGKWHLFFQHNPVGLPWGNMTWGHATSRDLVHWKQQQNVLFPKTMAKRDCFSGGATVDKKNTAGWGKNTLAASFTDTGCGEAIAYSTDGGQTFTYYRKNPVVDHNGRDPKVIWYEYDEGEAPLNNRADELGGHWVMVVYDVKEGFGRNAAFYTSTNLKKWTEQSHSPGYFECPELFELPVGGDKENTRWVLFAADARYAVGRFDGQKFTPGHEGKHRLHWGPYYASQTFSNSPEGRRIQIGWLRIGAPGPYNQHFSFPHRLTLRTTDAGIRMFAHPVKEIEKLRVETNKASAQPLAAGEPVNLPVGTDLLDIRLTVEVGDAQKIQLQVPGKTITYDVNAKKLNGVPLKPVRGRITMQVLVDRSVMEIAGNNGRVYISGKGPAKKLDVEKISVVARGGDARLITLKAHELESIWNR